MALLVSDRPSSTPRISRRAASGRVSLTGQTAGFASSLERDWLIALDFDWRVQRLREQPYTLSYELAGRRCRYTPDIQADFNDGKRRWTVVYEVKCREDLKRHWAELRPRFKAAVADCRRRGWRFRIVTEREIRTPYLDNIKFLRRYRALPEQTLHKRALIYTLPALGPTTPHELLAATWADFERRMAAQAELWRLIANWEIGAELHVPLTMRSTIWLP
jgi:hypothetical protein